MEFTMKIDKRILKCIWKYKWIKIDKKKELEDAHHFKVQLLVCGFHMQIIRTEERTEVDPYLYIQLIFSKALWHLNRETLLKKWYFCNWLHMGQQAGGCRGGGVGDETKILTPPHIFHKISFEVDHRPKHKN